MNFFLNFGSQVYFFFNAMLWRAPASLQLCVSNRISTFILLCGTGSRSPLNPSIYIRLWWWWSTLLYMCVDGCQNKFYATCGFHETVARGRLTYFWDFSSVRRLPGWGSPFASCMGSGMWGNLGKGSRRWIRCSPCQLGSRPHSWARSFDPSSWYSWGLWSVHQSRWLNSMELPSFRWRSRKAVAPNRRSEANKCRFNFNWCCC